VDPTTAPIPVTPLGPGVNFIIPMTPLPNNVNITATTVPPGNLIESTYFEAFRILEILYGYIMSPNHNIDPLLYPEIFNININDWIKYIDDRGDQIIPALGRPISQIYPELIFLSKILAQRTRVEIYETIAK
jgi:hypothetical protein